MTANLMVDKKPADRAPDNAEQAAARPRGRKRQSRAERSEEVRKSVFAAAAVVIGERGYAEASISRIADLAGIALGSFYVHFESRQALFDELLHKLRQDMLAQMHRAVSGASDFYDVEERGIRAMFDYLDQEPGFGRILHEAEFVAPLAHQQHYRELCERYVESLRRAMKAGVIKCFSEGELEALASMLIHARSGLAYMVRQKTSQGQAVDREACIRTYMQMVRKGVS